MKGGRGAKGASEQGKRKKKKEEEGEEIVKAQMENSVHRQQVRGRRGRWGRVCLSQRSVDGRPSSKTPHIQHGSPICNAPFGKLMAVMVSELGVKFEMSRGFLVRDFGQDFRFGVRVGERKNEMLSKFKGEQKSRADGRGVKRSTSE